MKAPSDVDTLRDEACPVCGEADAYDGSECAVCGFVAPPPKFRDPDVDMHKKLDLRQDQAPGGGDVPGLNADINDQDGDGLDDNTGMPVDDEQAGALDQQPILECPNCGFQSEAAHPTSVSTADPQGGSDMAAEGTPDGVAEGDLCPACGKGLMESATQIADETGADPEADPDAMQDNDQLDPRDQLDPNDPDADPDAEDDPDVDPDADDQIDPDKMRMDDSDPGADLDDDGIPDDEESDDDSSDDDDEDDKKPAKRPFPPGKK